MAKAIPGDRKNRPAAVFDLRCRWRPGCFIAGLDFLPNLQLLPAIDAILKAIRRKQSIDDVLHLVRMPEMDAIARHLTQVRRLPDKLHPGKAT